MSYNVVFIMSNYQTIVHQKMRISLLSTIKGKQLKVNWTEQSQVFKLETGCLSFALFLPDLAHTFTLTSKIKLGCNQICIIMKIGYNAHDCA